MKTLRLNKLTLTVLLIVGVIVITAQVADKQTAKREPPLTSPCRGANHCQWVQPPN